MLDMCFEKLWKNYFENDTHITKIYFEMHN